MSFQTAGQINGRKEGTLAQRGSRYRVSLTYLTGFPEFQFAIKTFLRVFCCTFKSFTIFFVIHDFCVIPALS